MPTRYLHLLYRGVIVALFLSKTGALLRRAPSCAFLCGHATRTLLTMAMDDLDDDFLANFDVDAAVRNRYSTGTTPGSNKKLKISPTSTLNSNTALQATTSPFGEDSRYSRGTTTNPLEELSTAYVPPVATAPEPSTMSVDDKALERTLESFFGHAKYRPGQLQVLQAVMSGRDAAVFWATGSGKSICYQIPALHTGNVSLVVSPLISLMQDQVNKLNGLSQEPLATFLGSAQTNPMEEADALAGKYRVVYVTPEKLLSGGFLDQVARMHTTTRQLALIAVDESHCVSEWGHDFRVDYRRLHQIRNHPVLSQIPLVALTATAVPRVQNDIVSSLSLRNPLIALQSFDRPNLKIEIHKKKGIHAAMEPLLPKLSQESTIIYAPTRDQVQEIANYLSTRLLDANVEAYHAGLSHESRTRAHTNFLVGSTKVIVATLAFGMGIDKSDTRRVVHYGPPKTVEEYYQQIGRAGRDGLPAECLMFVSDGDFDNYKSDFYVGNLQGEAKANMLNSVDTLKAFALDQLKCRRKALLDFFQEEAAFGERCGTCDTCQRVATYGEDTERDLGPMGARICLKAIDAMSQQSVSNIEKVISGTVVEPYRYRYGCDPQQVKEYIQQSRREMKTRVPASHFRELFAPLVTKGFVQQGNKTGKVNGYNRSWTTYSLTPQGQAALNNTNVPIVLPVTQTLREIERKAEEKRQKVLKELSDAGVKIEKLPKKEVETGDGEVIRAFSKWHGYLESMRKNGRDERLAQLENLLARIQTWRSDTASKYRMAPAAVLAEHTMVFVAYTIATMKAGLKAEPSALFSAGVRSRELDSLVSTLNSWVDEVQPVSSDTVDIGNDAPMVFPAGAPFAPAQPWQYAVYKPLKKTGKASWESSHERFMNGEHPQAIAMSPENGKPIQMGTVVAHILDGLVQGRPVPLDRLSQFTPPPTKSQWEQLNEAEIATGMSVVDDPNTSGQGGSKFLMTEFLRPIMGDSFVDTPYNERSDVDKAAFGKWCEALKWYMALRRVGYEPTFSE